MLRLAAQNQSRLSIIFIDNYVIIEHFALLIAAIKSWHKNAAVGLEFYGSFGLLKLITELSFQAVKTQVTVLFHVPDDWLYRIASPEFFLNARCHSALLPCNIHIIMLSVLDNPYLQNSCTAFYL
ncbi:hypothetical protein CBQ28_15465 [Pseudoalteromonas sp. GCY]|nr:hypothetical protein CBQ28_15465 [Pseudoalteromonas sp. GCY]